MTEEVYLLGDGLLGPLSKRPDPSEELRWYIDKDTGVQYVSNGDAWIQTAAAVTNPLNTVAIQDKGGAVYNVKAYGAVGNGSTDDTTAIQNAINAASGGGVVYFPTGSYKLAATLTLANAKVTLRGAGMKASSLLAPISVSLNAVTVSAADCALEDLAIDGQYALQTNVGSGNNQVGIYVNTGAHRLRLSRVWLHDACGHGVSNSAIADDLLIDGCYFSNGGVAAGIVQAAPAPTTTSFGVSPGHGPLFAAGQSLRIGTQTGTVSTVTTAQSTVAAVTSTSVFTLTAGDGAKFANGQVIHIGTQSGTISSIATDTVTLTAPLGAIAALGQLVSIDLITLTGAITTPTAGQLAANTGAYLKGVYCTATKRPVIRDSIFTGWSQAIGLWYATTDAIVTGNQIINNYGYEDTAHTSLIRSAVEDYGNNTNHGRNRVSNNYIDGTNASCIECAQGVVSSTYENNTFRNWGADWGTGAACNGIAVTGQAGTPGITTDVLILGNTFLSAGTFATNGLQLAAFSYRVTISGNRFSNFQGATNAGAIIVSSGGSAGQAHAILGNTFDNCVFGIQLSTSPDGMLIQGNSFNVESGSTHRAHIELNSGSNHIVLGNTFSTLETVGWYTIHIIAGVGHRIEGNTIYHVTSNAVVCTQNGCHFLNNSIATVGSAAACILLQTAALGCVIRGNAFTNPNGASSYGVSITGSCDYTIVQDNHFLTAALAVNMGSAGTHNIIEPNHTSTVTKPSTYKLLAANTVGTTQVAVAHGLGYTPTQLLICMTSAGTIWRSAALDATNVTLTADSAGRTCDLYAR